MWRRLEDFTHLDSAVVLLAILLVFSVIALFVGEHFFVQDGRFQMVISDLITGIAGALLTLIRKPPAS